MGEKGFSQVELLVTTLLFLVAALGMLPLMVANLHVNADTRLRGEAMQVAAEIMARLNAIPYEALADESETIQRDGQTFTYRIDTFSNAVDDRRSIDLTITWSYRGHSYRYAVANVRVRNG